MKVGIRLRVKEVEIMDFTYEGYGKSLWRLVIEVMIGNVRIISVKVNMEVNRLITFIWSCTNFLAPKANGILLSYKSVEMAGKPWY